MARYPCDADGARYGGVQRSIYLSAYGKQGKRGWLLRLCGPHFEQVSSSILTATTNWEQPSEDEPIFCPVCNVHEAEGYLVATLFPDKSAPEKRAGCVCEKCIDGLLGALGVQASPEERG